MAPFLTIIFLSLLTIIGLLNFKNYIPVVNNPVTVKHPLELTTAIIFALSFVFFIFLTHYVTSHFDSYGLKFLAISVGFTNIDPFILSLLSGKVAVSDSMIVFAVILASGSNNLLKAAYAIALARNRSVLYAAAWLAFLFVISIAYTYKYG
jgi:uncharacterized membrane protein (DUF4010 family)